MVYTQVLSSEVIRSLFHRCDGERATMPDMMTLCDGTKPSVTLDLALTLLLSGLARFVQMTFTFGTGVPCGLFVPSLYTGACLGRVVGMISHMVSDHFGLGFTVYPGIYAMVGAAAVLGGVCRVTISLVVIMFELTGGLQLIMPFMVAVLVSKWVGDVFTGGIYDMCIMLRGYPFLHEPEDVTFTKRVCDIMDSDLECITAQPVPIYELLNDLQNSSHGGFPLIRSLEDHTLLGYIKTSKTIKHLQTELASSSHVDDSTSVAFTKFLSSTDVVLEDTLDLSDPGHQLIDESVIYVVAETPLAQVHNIFRQLGVKLVLVTRFGKLVGIITKKAFLQHLHEGHIGNITHDPVVHTSPLLPTPERGVGLMEPLMV
jgi:chloride channel 3/4/5